MAGPPVCYRARVRRRALRTIFNSRGPVRLGRDARSVEVSRQRAHGRSGRRRDELEGRHLPVHADRESHPDARHVPCGVARRLAAVPVRSERQIRPRDRYRRVRHAAGAASARRSPGQRLDCRSGIDTGDQVRRERTRADDSEPQAGGTSRAGAAAESSGDRSPCRSGDRAASGRRRRARRWRTR